MTETTNEQFVASQTQQEVKENAYKNHANIIAVDTLLTKNEIFWGQPIFNDRDYNYSIELEGQPFSRHAFEKLLKHDDIVGVVIRQPRVRGGLSVILRPAKNDRFENTFFVFVNDDACFEGGENYVPKNLKPSIENPYYLGVFSNGIQPFFYDILTLEKIWR